MGRSRIFLALTLAAIISLLAVALPASPALAAADISLDPEEGEIGDKVEVTGDGFKKTTESTEYRVYIFFSPEEADEGDDMSDLDTYHRVKSRYTDSNGDFDTYFYVPNRLTTGDEDEDVHGGTYYVYTSYKSSGDDIETVNEFTVIAGNIKLDTVKGTVGTEVEITGAYFASREDITVTFDGEEIDIESGDTDTDRRGEFDIIILIPESTAGAHTIAVEDESDHIAEATFTVEPEVTLSPISASMGGQVTVTGTGFGASVDVTITLDATQVATVRTSSKGSFETTFTVPNVDAGSYKVKARDKDGNSATASFTVAAGITVATTTGEPLPAYIHVGMPIIIEGTGFGAREDVTITLDATEVATATTDADGKFSATFPIPPSEAGVHTITASDGTNTLSSTFVMESTPPPIPSPLLPEMGIKAEQPVYFDWADVTDPSGVTYTLNIAKDEDFTSLVLEREGLTESEYTLTKVEKLPSTKKDAPYYWRVKAIDGASNESEWSGAGTFYVGFAFPDWMIHVWWGAGVGGAIALGYYLGRRRSYYY